MLQTWRTSRPFLLLVAVVAALILADLGIVAVRLSSHHAAPAPQAAQSGPDGNVQPCVKGKHGKHHDCPGTSNSPGPNDSESEN